jgi:outer membrane protein OmpA-like peptidoglycan-associated protein/uncharacterized protein YidB (DUF937 family)
MFEHLVNEAASHLNLSVRSVSALLRELLALMTNERTGGVTGFADLFHRAGHGDVFTSWFGGKESRAIAPDHVETTLGTNTIDRLAASSGLSHTATTSAIALMLPKLIAYLTPDRMLPTTNMVRSQMANYLEPVASVPHRRGERSGLGGWVALAAVALLVLAAVLWLRPPARTMMPQASLHDRDGNVIYSGPRDAPLAEPAPSAVGTTGIVTEVRPTDVTTITFATGSARISAKSMNAIRTEAQALKAMPAGSKVEIGGHTDNRGSEKSNLALSQARADAVRNALVTAGAPAAMITTKGYADTQPRATNETEEGRSQNRRIEYTVEQ